MDLAHALVLGLAVYRAHACGLGSGWGEAALKGGMWFAVAFAAVYFLGGFVLGPLDPLFRGKNNPLARARGWLRPALTALLVLLLTRCA